jgi:ABC-type transport system involved in cytochrome c biogenesis permease subunit
MDAAMIDAKLLLSALLELLPVLYGVAFFDYVLVFATDESMVRRLARPLLMTAVVANLIYLLGFTLYFEHIPLVTVYQALGAVGFSVAATYLFVESRTGTPHTGPFILFLVLVFQILNTLFPKLDRDIPQILGSTLFSFHVSAAVLGYSAFAVAAVYGLLYLMLYHQIRTKSFGLIFRRLPSLDILDRMNFYASVAGFTLLTVAIILGAIWGTHLARTLSLDTRRPVYMDPKVLVSFGTWALYGLAILGRQFTAWKGPRMAYSSLFGFLVVLFSLFAVNFFLTKFHVFVS